MAGCGGATTSAVTDSSTGTSAGPSVMATKPVNEYEELANELQSLRMRLEEERSKINDVNCEFNSKFSRILFKKFFFK